MPRPYGSIGETKYKILAIIYRNEVNGNESYGYNIWNLMKTRFHCYLENINLRNVYRHLKDLEKAGLIRKRTKQEVKNAPKRQLYALTEKGKQLESKFEKYLHILSASI
jgi:DNA-binding PadR family transcriptional regulator